MVVVTVGVLVFLGVAVAADAGGFPGGRVDVDVAGVFAVVGVGVAAVGFAFGILSCCPSLIASLLRPFSALMSSTVTPFVFARLNSVSLGATVYVVYAVASSTGMSSTSPALIASLVRPLAALIASTLALYVWAMWYSVSPLATVWWHALPSGMMRDVPTGNTAVFVRSFASATAVAETPYVLPIDVRVSLAATVGQERWICGPLDSCCSVCASSCASRPRPRPAGA